MKNLIWSTTGVDSQLIDRCPSFEQSRWFFWGTYLLMLAVMLAMSVLKFYAAINGDDEFSSMQWINVTVAGLVAIFALLFSLSLFRLMFSSVRPLRVPNRRTKEPWQGAVWIKLAFMLVMGLICAFAACLVIFDADVRTSAARGETHAVHLTTQDDESMALDTVYEKLAWTQSRKNVDASELAKLEKDIFDIRQRRLATKIDHAEGAAKHVGLVESIEYLLTLNRGLSGLIAAIFVFLFGAPVVINALAEQGAYEYLNEIQGLLSLARYRIVPNAKTVWLGESPHHIDRYLTVEALIERKVDAHNDLRSKVKAGLNDCLSKNKQVFSVNESVV